MVEDAAPDEEPVKEVNLFCSWITQMLGNYDIIFYLCGNKMSLVLLHMLLALKMQNQPIFWSLITRSGEKRRIDLFNYRLGNFILYILSFYWFSKKEHKTS